MSLLSYLLMVLVLFLDHNDSDWSSLSLPCLAFVFVKVGDLFVYPFFIRSSPLGGLQGCRFTFWFLFFGNRDKTKDETRHRPALPSTLWPKMKSWCGKSSITSFAHSRSVLIKTVNGRRFARMRSSLLLFWLCLVACCVICCLLLSLVSCLTLIFVLSFSTTWRDCVIATHAHSRTTVTRPCASMRVSATYTLRPLNVPTAQSTCGKKSSFLATTPKRWNKSPNTPNTGRRSWRTNASNALPKFTSTSSACASWRCVPPRNSSE